MWLLKDRGHGFLQISFRRQAKQRGFNELTHNFYGLTKELLRMGNEDVTAPTDLRQKYNGRVPET